jgi:putative Mg2+ transporter-C (MgtC) family protein
VRFERATSRAAPREVARERHTICICLRVDSLERILSAKEFDFPIIEIVKRLLAALLLGAVVGWDREVKSKPAGLRTHMLVTLGSATFCIMAFEVGAEMSERYGDRGVDPMRVLQGVVGGIGFLGAGSIVQSRGHVKGVTTAAGVWIAGALGAACGVGAYVLAVFSATFTVLVLTLLGRLERRLVTSTPDPEQDAPPSSQRPRRRHNSD